MIGLIRADSLNLWADRITASGEFPRLIRLLIRAVVHPFPPKSIYFPADEATRLAGYDGVLELSSSVNGLPEGVSVWELSAEQQVKRKADEDYKKRTVDPKNVDQKNTCFVFVTPRKWLGKTNWAKKRSEEGKWKGVLAFDAEDLVQWLEVAPGVALWFGHLTGQVPDGARSLTHVMEEYCFATNPKFDPAGTLIGRNVQRELLIEMLTSNSENLEIEASTDQEGAAFVGACIESMPEEQQDSLWAKAIWVENEKSLRSLVSLYEGQLLILSTAIMCPLPADVWQRRHQIIRINENLTGRARIILGEQPMVELIDFIERQGIDRNEAYKCCYDAAASLERVRRSFMVMTPLPPAWSNGAFASLVAATILIGSWDGSSADDQAIVTEIVGIPYEQFAKTISAWTRGVDPLLICAGSEWKVHNRLSAWQRLEPYLTTSQLEALTKAVETIFLEPDPRFDLVPEKRWLANIYDKHRRFSSSLRQGLAKTLTIIAIKGDEQQPCYAGVRPQDHVNRSIHSIFQKQSEGSFWRRIRGELTEIAEASPDIFLEALEKDLSADKPQVLELFEDEGEQGACLHANLLWGLEILAWSAAHVGRVAHILASLAARDPGGRYSNRPANSLTAMFNPGQPQCLANAKERRTLIASLAKLEPVIVAALCERILSNRDGSIIQLTHKPSLRQWLPTEQQLTVSITEYGSVVEAMAKQLLFMAHSNPKHWSILLANLDRLVPDFGRDVLSEAEVQTRTMDPQIKLMLRTELRKLLHHQNQFHRGEKKDNWREEFLKRLHTLYQMLTPNDPIQCDAWLFDYYVEHPTTISHHWEDKNTKIKEDRLAAAERLATLGIEPILDRLKEFPDRRILGHTLGSSSVGTSFANALFSSYTESEIKEVQELIQGFALALFERDSKAFFANWILPKNNSALLSEKGIAALLVGLPCEPKVWNAAEQCGTECDRLYWCNAFVHFFNRPLDAERAARKLLTADRALDAIDLLDKNVNIDWLSSDGDVGLVIDLLRAGVAASNINPERAQHSTYKITMLLEYLGRCEKADGAAVMDLEWWYFCLLEYQTKYKLMIHKRLIGDPNLLVKLLMLCYLPEGSSSESHNALTEQDQRNASQACSVLNSWRPFEKMSPQEMPSSDEMMAYANELRVIPKKRSFKAVADHQLGRALSSCPIGTDGNWPHEVACQLIERLQSPELCNGFVSGKLNARGVTTRRIGEGGAQEQELADQYRIWQKALAITFPKTSALVGRLAGYYESDAHRMDVEDRRHH